MGDPQKWMLYSCGKSYGWFRGTPILGNLHINISPRWNFRCQLGNLFRIWIPLAPLGRVVPVIHDPNVLGKLIGRHGNSLTSWSIRRWHPIKNGTSSWEKRWWKLWTLKLWGSPNFLDEAKREISPAWFTDPVESSGMFLTLVSPIGQVGHEIQSNPMKSY